jgi:hypothetical protein
MAATLKADDRRAATPVLVLLQAEIGDRRSEEPHAARPWRVPRYGLMTIGPLKVALMTSVALTRAAVRALSKSMDAAASANTPSHSVVVSWECIF